MPAASEPEPGWSDAPAAQAERTAAVHDVAPESAEPAAVAPESVEVPEVVGPDEKKGFFKRVFGRRPD